MISAWPNNICRWHESFYEHKDFLGVLLDEKLSWKDNIKHIENKVAKNISLLNRTKLFSDKKSLLSYTLNYVSLSWGSTNRTNLKKPINQKKNVVQITNIRTHFDHTNKLFKSQKILNIYKLRILSVALFMYQIRNKTAPLTFSGSFEKICHGYPTNFSQFNYKIPIIVLNKSKFRISFRDHTFMTSTRKGVGKSWNLLRVCGFHCF